jgi:hypothetical protein
MNKPIRVFTIFLTVLLLGACNFSLKANTQQSSPAPATATSTIASVPVQATDTVPAATAAFTGLPPGEPPKSVASWLIDANTPVNAKNAYAIDGDNYANNQFERPFDKDLAYRPDLDIHSATLTLDSQWFYVTILLDGVQPDKNALIACYGVELDVNLDGRGDFVVWVQPPFTTAWSRENIVVYGSSKNTVGGPHPLLSDAPWKGDTYDTILFDGQKPSQDNAAWVRVSPNDPKSLQIAFTPDSVLKPARFLWNVWADDGIKDPSKFDYNDLFTKKEAGSPYKWDPEYPPKSITSLDNTCRAPYGFKPVGSLPGLCESQPTPGPTTKGATPTPTLIPPPK